MSSIHLAAILVAASISVPCLGEFRLTYTVDNPSELTEAEQDLLDDALTEASSLWEGIITGHESQSVLDVQVEIRLTTTGLASARPDETATGAGYTYAKSGLIWLNKNQIIPARDGLGIAAGVDVLGELMAHETAHALGFGTLWRQNGVYTSGTGKYLGIHGLAAYRYEFDSAAEWVPVELAGGVQSANSHWDQLLRSAAGEGNPEDPLSLSPLTGIVDYIGRDLGLELMTAAIDPDYGEPFLSWTTAQSLRDLGYHVVPEPSGMLIGFLAIAALSASVGRRRRVP